MEKNKEKQRYNKEVIEEENINKNSGHGLHYSFTMRLIIKIVLLILLLIAFTYSLYRSFSITNKEVINFNEKGDTDYSVYLKDNNFYETPYLGKGMAYVASLIDNIDINYSYALNINRKSNLDITYQVKAKLIIASQANGSTFLEKEYDLSKEVIDEMVDKDQYIINKHVSIDYNYYNDLANQFKSNYAVNSNSYLDVYLEINEKNKENNSYEIDNHNKLSLRIPLSQQEVSIIFNDARIDNNTQMVYNARFIINDVSFFALSIVLAIIVSIIVVSLMKTIFMTKEKRSKYDRFVSRLLRGYDRVIVNVKTVPNRDDYNLIKVDSFQELLDVRDNTKEPINYHVVIEHQKCEFFVINQNNLYLYTVKSVDLNGEVEHGKEKPE